MIELGRWYDYHIEKPKENWAVLPLHIGKEKVYSLDVKLAQRHVVIIEEEELSWFTERMQGEITGDSIKIRKKKLPSFVLENEQKAEIFNTIFRN